MQDIEIKRQQVQAAYPGLSWRQTVKEMTEQQVMAVYFRLKRKGKI